MFNSNSLGVEIRMQAGLEVIFLVHFVSFASKIFFD